MKATKIRAGRYTMNGYTIAREDDEDSGMYGCWNVFESEDIDYKEWCNDFRTKRDAIAWIESRSA